MTREDVLRLLDELCGAYPQTNFKNPKATVTIWQIMFENENADDVINAARMHIADSHFFPTPADIKAKLPFVQAISSTDAVAKLTAGEDPDDEYLKQLDDDDDFIKKIIEAEKADMARDCAACEYDKYNTSDNPARCRYYKMCIWNI